MAFELDCTLEHDSIFIDNLELCQLRLINSFDFPWVILVPRRNNILEITDLTDEEFILLNSELLKIATAIKRLFKPDKLNIATIGNVVPQMHFHIVARFKSDKLFPKTVWGHATTKYPQDESNKIVKLIKDHLNRQ